MRKKFICYAQGHEGAWEAFCLDLDLAVQARTFEDVYRALNFAIADYVQAALQEDAANRNRLLSRKAPLWDRAQFYWLYLTAVAKTHDNNMKHGFTVLSPA